MKRLLVGILSFFIVVTFANAQNANQEDVQWTDTPLSPEYERAKQVYTHLAWASYLQASKRLLEAKSAYQLALKAHESSAFLHAQLATLSYSLQDINTAEREVRRAIELRPEKPAPHFLLGRILIQRLRHSGGKWKNAEEAIAEFKKVVELDPNHVEAHRTLGKAAMFRKDYELAVHSFKELTRIRPYEPEFYISLGNAYKKQRKTEEEIAAYERAVKIDRDKLRVHKELLKLYAEQYQEFHNRIYGRGEWKPDVLENAEESLKKVIGAYTEMRRLARPKHKLDYDIGLRDSRARLGHLYLTSEKPEKAIEVLQEVLAEDSDHIDSNFGIGLAYQELGNFEKAEYHLRKTIEISPDRLQAYDSLGFLYLMFEKPGKGIEIWQQLLGKDADRVDGNYGIGMAYQELGNFEKAEYHLRKAIELAPQHEEANNALGYLFAENGTNLDEAVTLVKKALRKSPQNGAYLDSLGWTYYKQGKLNEALTELEKALDYMPESADVQDHLGDVYIKKGLKQKAVAMWQKAVQLEPDNMKIREKLRSALEE